MIDVENAELVDTGNMVVVRVCEEKAVEPIDLVFESGSMEIGAYVEQKLLLTDGDEPCGAEPFVLR